MGTLSEDAETYKKRIEALSKSIVPDISKMVDLSAVRMMAAAMEPYQKMVEQQALQLRVLSAPIFDQIKLINPSLIQQIAEQEGERIKLVTESLAKSIAPILETFKNIDFEGFEEYCKEFGWIESIPISYANELQKKLKEENKDQVWDQLVKDISADFSISSLKKDISENQLLSKREKILSKALEHHKNKDYISSIPLLLSQIEGTFWDIGIAIKKIKDEPNSRILLESSGNVHLTADGKEKKADLQQLLKIIFPVGSKFKEHTRDKVYSNEFRNPILHGREINYNDEKRSAMLILMVHVLLYKIGEIIK